MLLVSVKSSEKMNSFIESFKLLLQASPWLKLAFISFMGMLGGSTFVAFINKYAIYNYMLSYGARLPLEGVQFIDIAVSVMSFLVVFASLVSLFFVFGLMSGLSNLLHRLFAKFSVRLAKVLSNVIVSVIAAIFSALVSIADLISSLFGVDLGSSINPSGNLGGQEFFFYAFVIVSVISLLVYKEAIKYFSIAVTIAAVCFISFSLFDANKYSMFLKEIQYGGGIPVKIALTDKSEVKGHLILNTKDSMILWDENNAEYIDIAKSKVKNYYTETHNLSKMPQQNGQILDMFKHFIW